MMQVPESMLSPNLHIATCRLPEQEALRGNAANDIELWFERWMLIIKKRSKYRTIGHVEKSYILNTELTARALLKHRMYHKCALIKADPQDAQSVVSTLLCGDGDHISSRSRVIKCGLDKNAVETVVSALLRASPVDSVTIWRSQMNEACLKLLDTVVVTVHKSAEVLGIRFHSRAATPRGVRSRNLACSFMRVFARDLIPVGESLRRLPMMPEQQRGMCICYVHSYVRIRCHGYQHDDLHRPEWDGEYALKNPKYEEFVEFPTFMTDAIVADLNVEDMWILPLRRALEGQLILITPKVGASNLRFVIPAGKRQV
jgi:hypothetical protein